jgi:hypothetical protein
VTLIHISNDATHGWHGYLRAKVDTLPDRPSGNFDGGYWKLGNKSGLDTWFVDVFCGLAPGERRTINLNETNPETWDLVPIIDDPHFLGGIAVTIAGVPMKRVSVEANGAGYDVHYRCRVGRMMNLDLHLFWYSDPNQPGWCGGELIPTASNPDVTDIVAPITEDLVLRFGDADVWMPGRPVNTPIRFAGDWFADGQNGAVAIALSWDRLGANRDIVRAYIDQKVQMRGIKNLHYNGNPALPAGFDGKAWTSGLLDEVTRVLTTWERSPLDPATDSSAPAAQGGQALVCAPAIADPSCIGPLYLAALDGSWPMFHLEASGKQLDWKAHQGLRMFFGRPNWKITTDFLGKTSSPDLYQSHSYKGPEDEHWFDFVLIGAARLKGTPATQWALRMHAIQFLYRYVVEPPGNWLTATRGVGWMSFLAAELYRNLEDRELAEAVKTRWIAVYDQLIQPQMGTSAGWWGWMRDDRIGPGIRAIPWQCSVLALGLRWAGDALDYFPPIALSQEMALDVIDRAWVEKEGRWLCRDVICLDGSDPGPYLGAYQYFGMPYSVAAMLYWNPAHATALAIWRQLVREATTWEQCSWLAPLGEGVQP